MTADGRRARWGRAILAIVAAAFSLRIGVAAAGPLIDAIRHDTHMSATLAGALGSIPFFCMGLFTLAGVPLVRRFGARALITGALAVIVVGTLVRAVMPTAGLIVLATVPIGVGMALAGLALPGVIRRTFPARTGAAAGAYVAALSGGAALTALTVVPLADAFGGWRGAFAISVVPTVLALPLWLLLPRDTTVEAADARPERRPVSGRPWLPSRLGWQLAAVFGLQSMCFAAMVNWIAALYTQAGWSIGAAAFTTASVSILTVPAALVIPALSDGRERRKWLLGCAIGMAVGMLGLAFVPKTAPWLWIIVFSVGNGALFPLTLTLPLELAHSHRAATELTGWMLGFGYVISATGPLVVGGLHDVTGGFTLPVALLGALSIFSGVIAMAPGLRRRPARVASATALRG